MHYCYNHQYEYGNRNAYSLNNAYLVKFQQMKSQSLVFHDSFLQVT